LNIPNIECIICTSGDINPSTYDQRVARGKTIDFLNVDKKCTIINLFIDDFILNDEYVSSRDKEKLESRQINVKNAIWLENIQDLFATIKNNA
jgi:superfamily II DNA or RNA helicase